MSKRPTTKIRTKSFKADGTPKKRWSSAERAAKGHAPRKSGGRPRNEREGDRFERRDDRSGERGANRSENRWDNDRQGGQGERSERRWEDRGSRDNRGGRPWENRGGDRPERDNRGRRDADRPWENRGGDRARDTRDRRDADRPWENRGDRGQDSRGGRPWENRGGDRDRDNRGRRDADRPWENRGDRGQDSRGGRPWENRGGDRDRDNRGRRDADRPWEDRGNRFERGNHEDRFERGDRQPRGEERREHRRPEHKPHPNRSWESRDRRREDRRDEFRREDRRDDSRRDDSRREDRGRGDRDDRGFRGAKFAAGAGAGAGFGAAKFARGGDRSFDRRDDRDRRDNRDRREDRDDFDGESADQMSWTATELAEIDADAVADDAGFAELGLPKVLVGALDQQGITSPFPIQAATIPDALAGKDVLGRGRTGSGKTLGFGLPLLARLANGDAAASGAPGAIVLVPTRELALQVADVLAPLAKVVGLSTTLVAGGMAFGPQIKAFDRGVDVVVATPGRLIDLMEQGVADLSQVQIAVLDEADHMADLGFMTEVTTILDAIPVGGQRLLFSATLDRGVDRLVEKYLTDPVTHQVDEAKASVSTMHHHVLHVLPHDKNAATAAIANREGRTVVFVRTQRGADRVADQLREAGVMAGALHGGLTQGARARILNAFKEGTVPVLVATDVAARGIHVDEVSMVLQVDPPMGPKDYLHRAGRTARAGQEGHVAIITLPHQRKLVRRLTDQAGVRVEPVQVRPGDELLSDLTGARRPEGEPIAEEAYQALIAPPRAVRKHGPKKKGWGRDSWDNERGGRGGRGGRPQHRRGPRD